MKIKSTLMAVFVTSIALSVIVLIASIMLTSSMGNLQQTYIDESEILKLKADFIVVSDQLTTNARAYVNTENDVFYNAYMTEVNETQSYARILSEMESLLPANLLRLIQETQAESASLAQQEIDAFEALEAGDKQRAIDLVYNESYFASKETINGLLNTFDDELDAWIAEEVATVESSNQVSLFAQLGAIGLFFIFVIAAIFFVLRKVKPLESLTNAAEQIATGDLTVALPDVEDRAQDEVSVMARSFTTMIENVKGMLHTVNDTSSELSASSEELLQNASQTADTSQRVTHAVEEIAHGATAQGTQIQESSRAMTEVATGITHIATTAADVAHSSEDASLKAREGGTQIDHAVTDMKEIENVMSETMLVIDQLALRSQDIENIVSAIVGIADQTNLLALNASIEAARAGEAGKGFAVVADEVRKLAEQSTASAQQITQIIQAIQQDTQNTVLQMARVNEKVATGVATVSETGQSFAKIIASTENVTQQIQQVSAVSEQMAASAQQISATFESISAISTQSSATTEQVSDLAQEQFAATEEITAATNLLTDLATKLNEEVNHFKLR